jgi:hypothetical protein
MPPAIAAAGIVAAGGIGSALIGSSASRSAANAQSNAAQLGIAEQQREYDQSRSDLLPWLTAGQGALGGLQALLGLSGNDAQQAAITGIQNSPQFASLDRAGTQAILQNAAATGGLRGGNVQSSLYNNRADLLAQLIDQQFSRLAGVSGAGASVGANLGQLGAGAANAISGLFGQQGAARAGGILGSAGGLSTALQGVTGFIGNNYGSLFGGGGGGILAPDLGATQAISPGLLNPQPLSSVAVNWGF